MKTDRSDYKKEIRQKWIAEGRCSNCGAGSPVPGKQLCDKCGRNQREFAKNYRAAHPEVFRKKYYARKKASICVDCGSKPARPGKIYCERCTARVSRRDLRLKYDVMQLYGGKCRCCGEANLSFLSIDHVNNDGSERRKSGEHHTGSSFYRKLLRARKASRDLQVLCYNCNFGKRVTGVCPHKDDSYVCEVLGGDT